MQVIHDDRAAHFAWLEREGLLYCNTDTWMPCPGSYGFVSDLPETSADGESARLADCWVWVESQESEPISPKMFNELLPALHRRCHPTLRARVLGLLRAR